MRLFTALALVTSIVGCADLVGSSPAEPERDEYDLANACQEVATGSVPDALVTGDEMFNASQLNLSGKKLRFLLSNHGMWAGGVVTYDLDQGSVGRSGSGDIDQLAVGARSVYWFEHWGSLYRRPMDAGSDEEIPMDVRWLGRLSGDPSSNDAWFVKSEGVENTGGTLYRVSRGVVSEVATGGFDDTLAVTSSGVWAFTRFGSGVDAHGQLVFWPRSGEFRSVLEYGAGSPVDLRADDATAVYLFEHSVGAIAADGSNARVLHETTGVLEQLAIDATYAYFTERTTFGAAIRRVARDGSTPVETLTEMHCRPKSLAAGRGQVFFTTYAWDHDRAAPGALWSIPSP